MIMIIIVIEIVIGILRVIIIIVIIIIVIIIIVIIVVYLYSADFITMSKSASQVPKNNNTNIQKILTEIRTLKRCVLSFLLKVSIESHFLISKRRLFHNRGAQTEKAREPYVLGLNLGSSRSNYEDDLDIRIGT